jgi:hypothetical protein
LRWDLRNGVCLCSEHHTDGLTSAHKSPAIFIEWLEKRKGKGSFWELKLNSELQFGIDKNKKAEELLSFIDNFESKSSVDEIKKIGKTFKRMENFYK